MSRTTRFGPGVYPADCQRHVLRCRSCSNLQELHTGLKGVEPLGQVAYRGLPRTKSLFEACPAGDSANLDSTKFLIVVRPLGFATRDSGTKEFGMAAEAHGSPCLPPADLRVQSR